MNAPFDKLSDSEKGVLQFGPAWIALLIAGADDRIDGKELKSAAAFIDEKKEQSDDRMKAFYVKIAANFTTDLNGFKELLPKDTGKRNRLLVERIKQLNHIFQKMDRSFTKQYYRDMRDLALKVAEASGGIMGLNPVNKKERALLSLWMLDEPL